MGHCDTTISFTVWPTGVSPIFGLYRVNRFLTSNTEAGTCNGRTLMVISVRVRYAYFLAQVREVERNTRLEVRNEQYKWKQSKR